jgi:hypothetical protein
MSCQTKKLLLNYLTKNEIGAMKKEVLIICCLILMFARCTSPVQKDDDTGLPAAQLPRALIITTGISEENPELAEGIVIAMQSFNKYGATVRLEPRDILFKYNELAKYNILILSTFPGYHDADKKYSLSCMSDEELNNLSRFVEEGGTLISGENVGRNYTDGTDRILVFQHLNNENWPLAGCYGVTLSEKNMTGYSLTGNLPGYFQWDISRSSFSGEGHELWTLVPDSYLSKDVKTLAYWKKGSDSTGAVFENKYGKGRSILLASSGLLHPRNDGGLSSEDQIDSFYHYIIDSYCHDNDIQAVLNPWPSGYDYAFSVTLNAEGDKEQYARVFTMLDEKKVKPTLFVSGLVNDEIRSLINDSDPSLASSGWNYVDHADLSYPQAAEDILMNEVSWNSGFKGFRFPFTSPALWTILALDENNYAYESSLGADNLDLFHGSVVPYNLVITIDGFFHSTDILELAPSYHDDYFFLDMLTDTQKPDSNALDREISVYRQYLLNYWKLGVKPYNGLMVFLGHPGYVGYNESTLGALGSLIEEVKKDNTWITTLDEVAAYRAGLDEIQFKVVPGKDKQRIEIIAPDNVKLDDVCLKFNRKIKNYKISDGKGKLLNDGNGSKLIFRAFNGQTIAYQLE